MSEVNENQPTGTPTWIDYGTPDLETARRFYGALFGWEFATVPALGDYTMCLLRGRPVAAMTGHGEGPEYFWNVYLATDDTVATAAAAVAAGAELLSGPFEAPEHGVVALLRDPSGAQLGLWQGTAHHGCALVNEPNTLVRNDLVTADADTARTFYARVFGLASDSNATIPGHTFLRRPDGHEIGGIIPDQQARMSRWGTAFEVADADAAVTVARANGGSGDDPVDFPYGRIATVRDPFGAEFAVIRRTAPDRG